MADPDGYYWSSEQDLLRSREDDRQTVGGRRVEKTKLWFLEFMDRAERLGGVVRGSIEGRGGTVVPAQIVRD